MRGSLHKDIRFSHCCLLHLESMSQACAQRPTGSHLATTLNETAAVIHAVQMRKLKLRKLICPVTGIGDYLVQGQEGSITHCLE